MVGPLRMIHFFWPVFGSFLDPSPHWHWERDQTVSWCRQGGVEPSLRCQTDTILLLGCQESTTLVFWCQTYIILFLGCQWGKTILLGCQTDIILILRCQEDIAPLLRCYTGTSHRALLVAKRNWCHKDKQMLLLYWQTFFKYWDASEACCHYKVPNRQTWHQYQDAKQASWCEFGGAS